MLSWIVGNVATIVICLVLAAVIAAIVIKLVRDKKKGKSTCGCGCGGCAMKDACHGTKNKK